MATRWPMGYMLGRQYGITLQQYKQMFYDQNGVCAICHEPPKEDGLLHVDHDHDSGVVRALLCHGCNAGIGLLKEDVRILAAAIIYLEDHKGPLLRDFS